MGGQEPVVTVKAISLDLLHHSLDVVIKASIFGAGVSIIRKTNPSLVALLCSFDLKGLGDLDVLGGAVIRSLDPYDGQRLSLC